MTEESGGMLKRNDPAYATWLTDNPAGFVLLERTDTIHRAGCPSVRPTRFPERRPSNPGGEVWCSRGIAPLEYSMFQGRRLSEPVPVRFPETLLVHVRERAAADDRSLSSWIRRAVEHELAKEAEEASGGYGLRLSHTHAPLSEPPVLARGATPQQ